jgi:hypothetical protein
LHIIQRRNNNIYLGKTFDGYEIKPKRNRLTGADDIASHVESGFEVVGALADVISALHVAVALLALPAESATLVQLPPYIIRNSLKDMISTRQP